MERSIVNFKDNEIINSSVANRGSLKNLLL